jgi:glycosyltransferase involved in cell wall biosynthesis
MVIVDSETSLEEDEPGGDSVHFAHINVLSEVFSEIFSIFSYKKKPSVSLIIPAYNEAPRIGKIIKQAKLVENIREIIVVDDGSKDGTDKVAKDLGVEVVKHHKNLGKGEALKTGIAHAKNDVLLFLDADLNNMTPEKINALIRPILRDKADFVKAGFTRSRGRATEFAIKPMMKLIYPDADFKQPISGQFAGRTEFLKNIAIESKWGIDIAILLDAIEHGQRIVEVNIGELVHRKSSDESIAEMSKQVMETILKKAGHLCSEHEMIIFSDKTVFSPIFSKKVEQFLKTLRGKKIRIVILSEKKIKNKYMEFFDEVKIIKRDYSSKKIASIIKSISKKNGIEMKNVVLAANRTNFDVSAGKVGLSYCFSNSSKKLKEKCEIVSSLAEILMYLK